MEINYPNAVTERRLADSLQERESSRGFRKIRFEHAVSPHLIVRNNCECKTLSASTSLLNVSVLPLIRDLGKVVALRVPPTIYLI